MPLRPLVEQIVRVSEEGIGTPVLVIPAYLSLRKPFYVQLASDLIQATDRIVRIDLLTHGGGSLRSIVSDTWMRSSVRSVNHALTRLESGDQAKSRIMDASVQVTASLGRTMAGIGPLVVGVASAEIELPHWSYPIWICSKPELTAGLQLAG